MSSVHSLIAPLELPPGPPPVTVVTRLQSLPFGQLRWEDFEKLCLRLGRSDHEVEDAREYGVRGQAQYGIDLFARRIRTAAYTVYQCKKVDEFGPADITAAVDKFLDGPWAERADRFVLCTAVSLAPTQLAERLEQQKTRLAKLNVALVPWDARALDLLLKDYPELVDDFFGRQAVTAFCGENAAERLGRRLDGKRVAEYRSRLHALYSAAFDQLDPGLPIPPGVSDAPVDLIRRYVVPDVNQETRALSADWGNDPGSAKAGASSRNTSNGGDPSAATNASWAGYADVRSRLRQTLGAWLAGAQRCLLVGGTGTGKSTALRFVALDILGETPQLTELAQHWGNRLPVWVSFPYWTSLLAQERDVSLTECVRRWLSYYGHPDLWPLVDEALSDDRLLLIVDGMDEWATEAAARNAAHLLQVFVQAREVPILAAGRPPGIRRLELRGGRWSVAEIAELNARQQRQVARIWTAARLGAEERGPVPRGDLENLADQEAGRFVDQVRASAHLDQLAQTPMLLMLLLYLHFRNANLPSDRFDAYEKVIHHLLEDHPAARSLAALSGGEPLLPPAQVRKALASLAYRIQVDRLGGDIKRDLAVRHVGEALGSARETSLGLAVEDADQTACGIVATAEEGFGLLTRTGAETVRFFHRAIQEHLAAVHITRLPFDQQQSLVAQHGADPQWEPVVLSLLWLAQRPSETEALLGALPDTIAGSASEQLERIRAEVAFGPFDTSAQWAQAAARQAITVVEQGERPSHQAQILDRVLVGTGNARTSSLAADAVGRWAYNRTGNRPGAIQALGRWPQAPETWNILAAALSDIDPNVQHAAGRVIPRVYGCEEQARDFLVAAAKTSQRPTVRAAAFDALSLGWSDEPELQGLSQKARASAATEMNIAAVDYAVRQGTASDENLMALVPLISGDCFRSPNGWVDSVPAILTCGWTGNGQLRDMCLEGARRRWEHGRGIRKSIATALLAAAFPGDDQVAAWVAAELDHAEHPFLMALQPQTWRNIATSFRDHPVVVEAALRWLPQRSFHDSEVSLLALAVRTLAVRDLLIGRLPSAAFPHWEVGSLLEGWGMEDEEVASVLRDFVRSHSPGRAERIAHLIPQIIDDADEAQALLMVLLRAPAVGRPDLIIDGLSQLSDPGDIDEIVAAAEPYLNGGVSDPLSGLIVGFPRHARVRELAKSALRAHGAPVAVIAHAYATDDEMRQAAAISLLPASPRLRARLIRTLSRRPLADVATTALLEQFDSEQDGDIKLLAGAAWAGRLQADPAAAARAAEALTNQLQVSGFDHQERRRAAFAALLALGQADVFVSAGEGNQMPLVAPDLLHRDIEFVRLMAEHWAALTSLLGDQLPARISYRGETNEFWTSMCTVAAAYPATQPDVLRAIDADPRIAITTQALEFAAAVRTGSTALLDQLFLALDIADGPSVTRGDLETALTAADIIARQFADSPEVAVRLAGISLSWWNLGRVAALCRGWTGNEAMQALRVQGPPPLETWGERELLYATLPASQLLPELRKDITKMIHSAGDQSFIVTGPLTARLRRDPDAAIAFSNNLATITDPILKVAIPTALAVADVFTEQVADWCRTEIVKQSHSQDPELGFDLQTLAVRGVTVALSDVLLGG